MTEQENVSVSSDADAAMYEMMIDIETDLQEICEDLETITEHRIDIETYYTSQIVVSALLGLIAGILFVLVFKRNR